MRIPEWASRFLGRSGGQGPELDEATSGGPQSAGSLDEQMQGDQPLNFGSEDTLGRLPFAKRIADVIRDRKAPDSLVIAIYGPWGDGKTSVVHFVEDALRDDDEVLFVRFNPWVVGDRDQLLRSFFETVAVALGEKLNTRGVETAETIRRYSGYLAPLSGSIEAIHRTSTAVSTKDIEEHKQRISELLLSANKRVVVAIDDIDRLERSEIAALLKLVRLVADFERMVYLLAFDRRVVAESLKHLYAGSIEDGTSFLEKIVQVPLTLPPPEGNSLDQLTLVALDKVLASLDLALTEDQAAEFAGRFRDGIAPGITTPRNAIQFANAVAFALPMLKGEANLIDVLSVEAMRSIFPKVHEFVRDNGSMVLGAGHSGRSLAAAETESARALWGQAVKGMTERNSVAARALADALFPRLAAATGENNHYGDEWLSTWQREKRAAAPSHFERYFTYHVPEHQVSDLAVEDLVGRVQDLEPAEVQEILREHLRSGRADSLVRSLRLHEKDVPEPVARQLALALAQLGGDIPRPTIMFSFTTPFEQAAILISRLVERVEDPSQRASFAHDVVARANPVSFAAHVLRWLRSDPKTPPDERILNDGGERRVLDEVVARIANEAALGSPLYERYPLDAPLLLNVWARYGATDACRTYVANTFSEHPENALGLLRSFLPTTFSIGSGQKRPSDFERDQYLAVANVVEPAAVMDALRKVFPDLVPPTEYPRAFFDGFSDLQLAQQFAYLYEHAGDDTTNGGESGSDEDPVPDGTPTDDSGPEIVVTPDQEP